MIDRNIQASSRPVFPPEYAVQSRQVSASPQRYTAHSPLESFSSWFSGKSTTVEAKPSELSTPSSSAFDVHHLISSAYNEVTSSTAAVATLSAVSATGLTLLSVVVYRKYIKRIRNADYVTSGMIQQRKWIKGVVTRCVKPAK